jgi:hypothetical protein
MPRQLFEMLRDGARTYWPQCGFSARFAAGRLAPGWSVTALHGRWKVPAGLGVNRGIGPGPTPSPFAKGESSVFSCWPLTTSRDSIEHTGAVPFVAGVITYFSLGRSTTEDGGRSPLLAGVRLRGGDVDAVELIARLH